MKKEYQDKISEIIGVKPILIDSALLTAQRRKRLYWTNIHNISQPEDKNILLKDIIHENNDINFENSAIDKDGKSFCLTATYSKAAPYSSYEKKQRTMVFEELNEYIIPFDKTLKILEEEVKKGKIGYFNKDSQGNKIYTIHNKSVTLCGNSGGNEWKTGLYLFGCITPDRINKRQNGQRFNDGKKFYTLTTQDKNGILIEGYIRKLTPIECERLQGLVCNYTEGVSNNQRYKMLGNGFTVPVIEHILKHMGDLLK